MNKRRRRGYWNMKSDSSSNDQAQDKAPDRPSVQTDMQHIETQLNKFNLSIGHLLREVARRFHGVEVPPVGEELEGPSEATTSETTSDSVKEIKV